MGQEDFSNLKGRLLTDVISFGCDWIQLICFFAMHIFPLQLSLSDLVCKCKEWLPLPTSSKTLPSSCYYLEWACKGSAFKLNLCTLCKKKILIWTLRHEFNWVLWLPACASSRKTNLFFIIYWNTELGIVKHAVIPLCHINSQSSTNFSHSTVPCILKSLADCAYFQFRCLPKKKLLCMQWTWIYKHRYSWNQIFPHKSDLQHSKKAY